MREKKVHLKRAKSPNKKLLYNCSWIGEILIIVQGICEIFFSYFWISVHGVAKKFFFGAIQILINEIVQWSLQIIYQSRLVLVINFQICVSFTHSIALSYTNTAVLFLLGLGFVMLCECDFNV